MITGKNFQYFYKSRKNLAVINFHQIYGMWNQCNAMWKINAMWNQCNVKIGPLRGIFILNLTICVCFGHINDKNIY